MNLITTLVCTALFFFGGQSHPPKSPALPAVIVDYQAPDIVCVNSQNVCTGSITLPFSALVEDPNVTLTMHLELVLNNEDLLENDPYGHITGSYPDYTISGNYPIGQHLWLIQFFEDGVLTTTVDIPFWIADCADPTLTCPNFITRNINNVNGLDTLYATEFLSPSASNDCSLPVHYSIRFVEDPPTAAADYIIITCCTRGVVQITARAEDNTYNPFALQPDSTTGGPNYVECTFSVLLNWSISCNCYSSPVTGRVANEGDTPIANVNIHIESDSVSVTGHTGTNGNYNITTPLLYGIYTLTPEKDTLASNGVSTLDLLIITKHILFQERITDPYKIIAADANHSNTVTTQDLIALRKLILHQVETLPNNTSWRFVRKSYTFPNPEDPWSQPFPESIELNLFTENGSLGNDFIAIKVGDLNGTADTTH